jgi:hypothetical protein
MKSTPRSPNDKESGLSGAPTVQNDVDCARAALALVPDAA